jgi:hypothetical protein
VANLSVGNHKVTFNTISGWETPAPEVVAVSSDSTTATNGVYVVETGSLEVTLTPAPGLEAGAQWQVDQNGIWLNSGTIVSNLAVPQTHTVSFQKLDHWTAPSEQTVTIKKGLLLKVAGAYTFNGAGIYNGLFANSQVTPETAGMLSRLDIMPSGAYSGKIFMGSSTFTIGGTFDGYGKATNREARAANLGPLTVELQMNWNQQPYSVGGSVSGTNGGAWSADLLAELAANGLNSAEYTVLLLPAGTPPGYGYMLITNDAGAVTLSVTLADGMSFSQNVPLSGKGDLPVYGNLYGNTGLLLGWLGLESGSPAGNLAWIKPASRSTAYYTNGFTNLVAVQGSPWTNPPPHTAAIDLPSGQLEISGGLLVSNLTFNVAVSNQNNTTLDTLVKRPGGSTNSMTGSVTRKTGLLKVTFGNGAGKATTTGTGAVLQNVTNAAGFFLGKTNAGSILLQP